MAVWRICSADLSQQSVRVACSHAGWEARKARQVFSSGSAMQHNSDRTVQSDGQQAKQASTCQAACRAVLAQWGRLREHMAACIIQVCVCVCVCVYLSDYLCANTWQRALFKYVCMCVCVSVCVYNGPLSAHS